MEAALLFMSFTSPERDTTMTPSSSSSDDGLLLLEQGAEAELFRNGVGRRPHHAEGGSGTSRGAGSR